jgi:hypothetical protein
MNRILCMKHPEDQPKTYDRRVEAGRAYAGRAVSMGIGNKPEHAVVLALHLRDAKRFWAVAACRTALSILQ